MLVRGLLFARNDRDLYGILNMMERLYKKAQRWAQIIGALPGVRSVFLSGSLAQGKGSTKSDIDFFIITEPGQIWTARFCTNVLLKLSFNLSKPVSHAGKICPNHFISADSLEIAEQDAYSAHLFSHNQPLYDPLGLWPEFVKANDWVHEFGEVFPVLVKQNDEERSPKFSAVDNLGWGERLLRWIQQQKIYRNPDFKKPGAKIVLKNNELRFHPEPKNQFWTPKKEVDLGKKSRQAKVEINPKEA